MIKRFLKSMKSDRADSLVSAVFVLPVIFFLLITTVDFGIYMSNRGIIQGIARDGARTVSIMGGNGTSNTGTPLEKAYGQSRSTNCTAAKKAGTRSAKAVKTTSTAIECNMMVSLNNSTGLVNTQITGVVCTPSIATAIGQNVSCEVSWQYKGIPGSGMSFIRKDGTQDSANGLSGVNKTAGSSESEVKFSTGDSVTRK